MRQLKQLASWPEGIDCFIQLNYGARSSKHIQYDAVTNRFHIHNGIDDTMQHLTDKQLMDQSRTNIGKALKLGALYLIDTI